jgi:hypothetical protein
MYREPTHRLWGFFKSTDDEHYGDSAQTPSEIHIQGDEPIEQQFNSQDVKFDTVLRYTNVRLDKWAYSDEWKPDF